MDLWSRRKIWASALLEAEVSSCVWSFALAKVSFEATLHKPRKDQILNFLGKWFTQKPVV